MITLGRAAFQTQFRFNEYYSKAFAVAAGNTDNVNSFSVEFNADGRTITMNNNSSTEAVLGQYFGYNQQERMILNG